MKTDEQRVLVHLCYFIGILMGIIGLALALFPTSYGATVAFPNFDAGMVLLCCGFGWMIIGEIANKR